MHHSIDEHFERKSQSVRKIYDTIVAAGRRFGPVEEDAKKTSIHLNRRSAFAGIQTRRDFLTLTVKAGSDINSPRISKRERASANRWHHEIRLSSVDEVDVELIGWLRDSYDIS